MVSLHCLDSNEPNENTPQNSSESRKKFSTQWKLSMRGQSKIFLSTVFISDESISVLLFELRTVTILQTPQFF